MKRNLSPICAVAVGVGSLLPLTTYSEPTTELSVAPTEAAAPAVAAAPVVVEDSPGRDVKLTFAQVAPPPGSMVLRGLELLTGTLSLVCAAMKWYRRRC